MPAPTVAGNKLNILVSDERPYVLSGDKSQEWIGLQRSGFGIPYGVHTSSGKTLAEDIAASISKSFQANNVATQSTIVPLKSDPKAAINSLPAGSKSLIVQIQDWKSDTLTDISFNYKLLAQVINAKGVVVATDSISGGEKLEGSAWNPIGESERKVFAKTKALLQELLAKPGIVKALR